MGQSCWWHRFTKGMCVSGQLTCLQVSSGRMSGAASALQGGQRVTLPAPIGQPPVFYRAKSPWASLFAELKDLA